MAGNSAKIDDLVAMLDQFMNNGGGHMNVLHNEEASSEDVVPTVDTKKSNECQPNMACSIPTLHQGIDDEDEPTI